VVATDFATGDGFALALLARLLGDCLALNCNGFGHAGRPRRNRYQFACFAPSHKLLTSLVDVVPSRAATDPEEVSDRGCHVAAA
jgi:hypothetical protein